MIEPPERYRRWTESHRRAEILAALTIGGLLVVLWQLGGRSAAFGGSLAQTLPAPPSTGTVWVALGLVLALIVLNALFVGAETAVELMRPMHVKHLKESDPARAPRAQTLLDRKAAYVGACTFGSHLSRAVMVLAGFSFAPGVARWMETQYGWPYEFGTLLLAAVLVAIPIALLSLIVELVPKSYAALHPLKVALAAHRFVAVFAILFGPFAKLVSAVAGLVTARFGGRASFVIANQAEEEIKTIVESAEEAGEIESEEKELLHSVFEFTDTVAREVMTPRVDLDAMPVTSTPDEVMRVIVDSGHSRIPMFEETDDQIVGIVHAKDLLTAMLNGKSGVSLRRLMRPALFVPENKNLNELLTEMRQQRSQMAIVQDEFGGTAGIVTIEDIVEELVGDIVDEYDVEEPEVVEVEGGWLVDGKTHVDDVNHQIGSQFETEEFDTIGGLVFGLFGRQPRPQEAMEAHGYRFTVAETDGRRILRLRLEKLSPAEVYADEHESA